MLEHREGGCHCGRVRFRAQIDLDLLSQCSCTVCTKKGILHLPVAPENFELLRGKNSLTSYTFGTGVAQHTFCSHCGMHAFYVPRSQPDRITVNARCLDDIDGPSLKPTRFFDGRHWEEAQRRRIAEGGHGEYLFARLGRWGPADLGTKGDGDDPIATPDDRGHELGGAGIREPTNLHQVGSPVGSPLPAVAGRIERRGGALVSDQAA
jgi:hypothetical protein